MPEDSQVTIGPASRGQLLKVISDLTAELKAAVKERDELRYQVRHLEGIIETMNDGGSPT